MNSKYTVLPLLSHCARQFYHTESLHLPRYSEETNCSKKNKYIHIMYTGYIKSPTTGVSQVTVSYRIKNIKTTGC